MALARFGRPDYIVDVAKTKTPPHILGGQATAAMFARRSAPIREKVRRMKEDAQMTFEEIGKALGISRARAHAIYHGNRPAA